MCTIEQIFMGRSLKTNKWTFVLISHEVSLKVIFRTKKQKEKKKEQSNLGRDLREFSAIFKEVIKHIN